MLKPKKSNHFQVFLVVCVLFIKVLGKLRKKNDKSVACDCASNVFYFGFRSRSAWRRVQTYEKNHFKCFGSFGFFLSSVWAVKLWVLLHFADVVKFVSLILCPIVFYL